MAIRRRWKVIVLSVLLFSLAGLFVFFYWFTSLSILTNIDVRGNELWMNGLINGRTYGQFEDALKLNPNIDTLVLEKSGGSLNDEVMIKLGYMLRDRGMNTMLLPDSVIHSGAVDLFLSGVERTIRIDGENIPEVGVHSWKGLYKEAKDYPKNSLEHKMNRDYIEYMLGKDDFYWFTIYQADADDIYIMDMGEIEEYGLYTKIEFVQNGNNSQKLLNKKSPPIEERLLRDSLEGRPYFRHYMSNSNSS